MENYQIKEELLRINNVTVAYGNKVIIRNIGTESFPFVVNDITREGKLQGQTVAVLGRSGSGKSTLFKVLSGILVPSEGSVTIPENINSTTMRLVNEGDVGFVQQNYPLSRNQTVFEMLMDAAKQGKLENAKSQIDTYLKNWGLENQRNNAACQLSGGQKQRVAIIEQLLCSHYYVIFDEPFSGLDIVNIKEVKESFEKITSSNEVNTILFSTHDIELAVELADLIYIIGYEKNADGNFIAGGTIIGCYDLKKMGLSWQNAFTPQHQELVLMIKRQMENS